MIALSVDGLGVRFGGLRAVDDVSFELVEGRSTALVGPNGAGKTTVFNLMTGFVKPSAGRVMRNGNDLVGLAPDRVAQLGIGRTFQNVRLFSRMSVLENVLGAVPGQRGENPLISIFAPRRVLGQSVAATARAREWLSYVGLDSKRDRLAGELSYGQQKRVSIARLLATDAEVLLLDEPSSGLDPGALDEIVALIKRLPKLGKTIALVEHNLEVVMELCEWLLFLDRGKLVTQGAPAAIFAREDLADLYFGKAAPQSPSSLGSHPG